MAFFKTSTEEEDIRDFTGNSPFIHESGMYEVIILHAFVDQSGNGSQSVNLHVECNGQEQMLWSAMRLTNNDGTPNSGQKLFNKLCIIADLKEVSEPESMYLPIGKNGEDRECMVLKDLLNLPVHLRVQMEYSLYEGKVMERKVVRNVFRYEDKATASEIVNDVEDKGSQYQKELEYADKIAYRDGLTEEDVQEFLKNRKSGKETEKKEEKKPSGGFGGKRNFGKRV